MIQCLRLRSNIGQFDSVTTTGTTFQLHRNIYLYAENGRGKTTLTPILRSLQTGESVHVLERRLLFAAQPPHVVVEVKHSVRIGRLVLTHMTTRYPDVFQSKQVHWYVAIDEDSLK